MKNRHCRRCGKEFTPTSANNQYCSKECRSEVVREYQRQYHRTYKRKNKPKTNYNKSRKEKRRAYYKAWYAENKEEIKVYNKKLRLAMKKITGEECEERYNCFECPFSETDCIRD